MPLLIEHMPSCAKLIAGLDMRAKNSCPKSVGRALILCVFALVAEVRGGLSISQSCIQLTASWQENPNQITLSWNSDQYATAYKISRKLLGDSSWQAVATVDGKATNWTDTTISAGVAYEYQAIKSTSGSYSSYGYICAGIQRGLQEDRGKVVLLVTKELAEALPIELLRLEQDLVGDGWAVLQHTVATTQSVSAIKDIVRADYNADPGHTKALFLFGHVPVPYSGNYSPDGHTDSVGAWPADVFYGDFDGFWSDTTVSNNVPRHQNFPGDGRFDQSQAPGTVRLQIGRVDLSNLTCFANKTPARSEIDLARQYLNKDHNWRHGNVPIERRAAVYLPPFEGAEPEPETAAAYRHFPAFFGRDQIRVLGNYEYFPVLRTNSCLWTYTASGGSQYGSDYIGTSDAFAIDEPQAVFTSFMGSYFGDWDQESDFLRAPLGTSGAILTAIYSGQPQWILHTMAMGEPIGYSALMTQNNKTNGLYPPYLNAGAGCVHIALMGDPTLRMHPVAPPSAFNGRVDANGAHLSWAAATDRAVRGYTIYKGSSATGPFTKISSGIVTALQFDDPSGTSQDIYMVRAVKLESSPSGSYLNLSQGIFFPDPLSQPATTPTALSASRIVPGAVVLQWLGSSVGAKAFEVQRRDYPNGTFQTIGQAPVNASSYSDTTAMAGSWYAYRVKALGVTTDSAFCAEAQVNLGTPSARLVRVDPNTGGKWVGRYGSEGYMVPAAGTNWPSYVSVTASNLVLLVYGWNMTDPELLQYPNSNSRIWSYWAGAQIQPLGLSFRFNDSAIHRVALYVVDYQHDNHFGTVHVINPLTGNEISSVNYSNYTYGNYLVFDLQNYADIRMDSDFKGMTSSTCGIFFDPPTLFPPSISPVSGNFLGKTTVTMQGDAGATILYTLDGQMPGTNALTYTQPFELTQSAVITARSVSGPVASGITQVSLTNGLFTAAKFVGIDTTTQGDWMTAFGEDGQWIADWSSTPPTYADFNVNGARTWLWSDSTTELRALNKYARVSGRVAGAWYANPQLLIDVNLYSSELHPVALYFMDWDGGRTEDVYLSDENGNLLDNRRVSDFSQGKYFIWNLKGRVRVTIQHIAGPNAILNGVFVGTGAPVSQAPPTWDASAIFSGGDYKLQINGQPGQVFYIQSSSDFSTWTDVNRVTISSASADFSIPIPPDGGMKFYRARLE
jgi:hypothetical protein